LLVKSYVDVARVNKIANINSVLVPVDVISQKHATLDIGSPVIRTRHLTVDHIVFNKLPQDNFDPPYKENMWVQDRVAMRAYVVHNGKLILDDQRTKQLKNQPQTTRVILTTIVFIAGLLIVGVIMLLRKFIAWLGRRQDQPHSPFSP
jgi:hypothetical protein